MESQLQVVSAALFPAKARRAVLEALFLGSEDDTFTMSALARRANLTPRAVAVEVKRLEQAGLVRVEVVGAAHVVRPAKGRTVARHLATLLKAMQAPSQLDVPQASVRESLAAYGAPLGERPGATLPLHEALLQGLKQARRDATVLRTLPVVVRKNVTKLDWSALKERARRLNLKAELGMLLDLTATVAQMPSLHEHANELRDRRRRRREFFPILRSKYEQELARRRTPPVVASWGFYMNMSEDLFRSVLEAHAPRRR
jgi:DNA-binding transcriptional ArsR family regulator